MLFLWHVNIFDIFSFQIKLFSTLQDIHLKGLQDHILFLYKHYSKKQKKIMFSIWHWQKID